MCGPERDVAIEPKSRKEGYWEDDAQRCNVWRHHHKSEVNEAFADDVVIDDVVPDSIKQGGCATARYITKNLLRNKFPQRFYIE